MAGLLFRQARTVDWPAVLQALRALPPHPGRGRCAGAGQPLSYGTFDLVARHCCGHRLRRSTTLAIAMTSYAFTLNLGSLIGGVGVRYRLYDRRGVDAGTIGQVVGTSVLTNWVGYLLLAAVLAWLWHRRRGGWRCTRMAMAPGRRGAGLHSTGFTWHCALCAGVPLTLRGHAFAAARWPVALWQMAASATNWMLMGAALWATVQAQVSYPPPLATVLLGRWRGWCCGFPRPGRAGGRGRGPADHPSLGQDGAGGPAAYRALYYFGPWCWRPWHWVQPNCAGARKPNQSPCQKFSQNGL